MRYNVKELIEYLKTLPEDTKIEIWDGGDFTIFLNMDCHYDSEKGLLRFRG